MSVLPADLMGCAAACVDGDEAYWRSAVSRSYYAAYHDSTKWAAGGHPALAPTNRRGEPLRGTHNIFIAQMRDPHKANPAEWQRKSVRRGILLRALYEVRILADYDLTADVTQEQARQAVADARTIMAA